MGLAPAPPPAAFRECGQPIPTTPTTYTDLHERLSNVHLALSEEVLTYHFVELLTRLSCEGTIHTHSRDISTEVLYRYTCEASLAGLKALSNECLYLVNSFAKFGDGGMHVFVIV